MRLLVLLVRWVGVLGVLGLGSAVGSTENSTIPSNRRYLNIGDGTNLEFEFPENTKGVIVISSEYRNSVARMGRESWRQTVRVRSLEPDVLSILNVSDGGHPGPSRSYIISVRSGVAGRAPLLIQLLEMGQNSELVLVEERSDYAIRVVPGAFAALQAGGLTHFSKNPVLFALLLLIFVNKCDFGCKVEVEDRLHRQRASEVTRGAGKTKTVQSTKERSVHLLLYTGDLWLM